MADITKLILADHDWFRAQFAKLDDLQAQTPIDHAALERVWRRLGEKLDLHAYIEEQIFYPQLLKRGVDDPEGETLDAIGDHNDIREFVTINRGTVKGGGLTKVGSHNLIMAYTHIAHDCQIGDHIIMANAATLGGHVTVEEWAVVGALCPVHQFVRIGAHSYIGGGTTITQNVLPFSHCCLQRVLP